MTISLWPTEAPYTQECGTQAQPSIKPYRVEGSRGAVVVCPGGGYYIKAEHEGDPIAQMINQAGVSAFVLDYRVFPCPHDAPLTDALRAIRLVRSMGYEKVGILGFSAGGHLASTAATLYAGIKPDSPDPIDHFSDRPDAFIPCYAVVSLEVFRHLGSLTNLLGERAGDEVLLKRMSPDQNVTPDTPPAFLWHTADDEGVAVENALLLSMALSREKVPFELHVFPHGAHGLGLAGSNESVRQWVPLLQKWLVGQGFAS